MDSGSFLESLSLKLYEFCQDKLFCDTVLVVGSQSDRHSFWAHSVVLAAASSFLCAEFKVRSASQSVQYCLPLPDCEPSAVKAVLRFIYTGQLLGPSKFLNQSEILKITEVCQMLGVPSSKISDIQEVQSASVQSPEKLPEECADTVNNRSVSKNHFENIDNLEEYEVVTIEVDESLMKHIISETQAGATDNDHLQDTSMLPVKLHKIPDSHNGDKIVCQSAGDADKLEQNVVEAKTLARPGRATAGRPCMRCGVVISPPWRLRDHHQKCAKRRIRSVVCPECGEQFTTLKVCRIHQANVHNIRPKSSKSTVRNASASAEGRSYVCDACGKAFRQPATLLQHVSAVHGNGARTYLCDLCGSAFATSVSLRHHLDGHEKPYVCDRCSRGFRARHLLEEHMMACQTGDAQPFSCSTCGAKFTFSNNLRRHEHSHRGQSVCSICGRVYKHKQSLDEHIRTSHQPGCGKSDPANKCATCGKVFSRSKFLLKHMEKHASRRVKGSDTSGSFACTICGRGFSHPRFLANHSFVHQEHKLLECPVCGKRFTHRRYLTMHALIHRDEKYACPVGGCTKQFPFVAHLMKHCRNLHGMTRDQVLTAAPARLRPDTVGDVNDSTHTAISDPTVNRTIT